MKEQTSVTASHCAPQHQGNGIDFHQSSSIITLPLGGAVDITNDLTNHGYEILSIHL
jgi:hypothetical protein